MSDSDEDTPEIEDYSEWKTSEILDQMVRHITGQHKVTPAEYNGLANELDCRIPATQIGPVEPPLLLPRSTSSGFVPRPAQSLINLEEALKTLNVKPDELADRGPDLTEPPTEGIPLVSDAVADAELAAAEVSLIQKEEPDAPEAAPVNPDA